MRLLTNPDAAPSRGRGLLGSMLLRRFAVVVTVVAVLVGMGGVSVSLSHGVYFGGVSPAAAEDPAPGETWTARSASEVSSWYSVVYGNGVFVAVARTGTNRVMTSPDGVTWTTRTAAVQSGWYAVTYGNGVFVAVSENQVMTSPDGVTWTARTSAIAGDEDYAVRVTYGNGVFVAVTNEGAERVMTSTDNGETWTARTAPLSSWRSVTYGNGVFVAVASNGSNLVMTSTDNGETWTARSAAEGNSWRSVTYGNGVFVAVARTGTNRVMTSGSLRSAPAAPTSLIATAGDGSASIAFTAGADGGSAITKYQYKVGSGAWTDAVGTTSPITITGLTNYQTVRIRLRAVSSAGDGAASTGVKVWPRIAGTSLTRVKAAGSPGIRAAFAALTPVDGTVSHYWVYAYAKDTKTVAARCRSTAAARGCLIKGLTSDTEYDVAVRGFFTLTGSPTVLPTVDSASQTVRTKN